MAGSSTFRPRRPRRSAFASAGLAHVKIDRHPLQAARAAPGCNRRPIRPRPSHPRDLPLWRRQRETICEATAARCPRAALGCQDLPFAALPLRAEVGGPRTLRRAGRRLSDRNGSRRAASPSARSPGPGARSVRERTGSGRQHPRERFSPRFRRSSSPRRRRTRSFSFSPVSVISSISSVSTFDDGGPGRLLPQTPRHLAAAKARSMVLGCYTPRIVADHAIG